VLKAPATTLVSEASSNPGVPFNLKRTKQAIKPPKINISDASSHHTANLPAGIPVEERCVATGPLVDIIYPFYKVNDLV
jgi:hypothetical protein